MFIKLTEDLITHQFYFLYKIKCEESIYKNVIYNTDLKEHEIYSLTGLENYGLIKKEGSQGNKVDYKLTELGERFYLFVDYEAVYQEALDELDPE